MTFKPLLAATIEDEKKLKFPLYGSAKLDGIRALVIDGVLVSRNLKPIRNKFIQSYLGKAKYNGLDGELLVGEDPHMMFNRTSSGVMRSDGEPDFSYSVFDNFLVPGTFKERLEVLEADFPPFITQGRIKVLNQKMIISLEQLLTFEEQTLNAGHEGVMLRSIDGKYKNGRSSFNEHILMKLKRFKDDEAMITGFAERLHNGNVATKDALGHTERSSHKENMVGRGDLGAFVVQMSFNGQPIEFTIGSGMDDTMRKYVWEHKGEFLGALVKFKYFEYGSKDAPRFPIFLGIRDRADLS